MRAKLKDALYAFLLDVEYSARASLKLWGGVILVCVGVLVCWVIAGVWF